jgi:hypothetical protein
VYRVAIASEGDVHSYDKQVVCDAGSLSSAMERYKCDGTLEGASMDSARDDVGRCREVGVTRCRLEEVGECGVMERRRDVGPGICAVNDAVGEINAGRTEGG